MDPFGADEGEHSDLSSFQPQADASADFYEVDSSETQATYDFGAPQEQQEQEPMSYTPEPVSYTPEPVPAPMSFSMPAVEEENELTKFMRKYEEEIAGKAQEQEKVAVASKEKAKQDMDKFVAERSRIKESKQQSNRVAEQATLEKLAADLESENPWERVVSLVDLETNRKQKLAALNASSKKDAKNKAQEPEPKSTKKPEDEEDLSRMRQLFVQLKTTPLEKTRSQ